MAAPLLILLALTAAGGRDVTVEPLADGRFRVSATLASQAPPQALGRAMIRLRETAALECRGRAAPVFADALQVDPAPGRRGSIVLSETFSCGATPAPAAPSP